MPLLIGHDFSGIDGKIRSVIEAIVAPLQAWAAQVDGVNAAERLNELTSGISSLPTVPTGVCLPYGGSTAPTGYLLCNGAAVSRTTYATLFALFGTTYGAGNGSTTFNVPDLRRRFPMGKSSSDDLGDTGGSFDHTHTGPSHTHGAGTYATPTHNHGGETDVDEDNENIQNGAGAAVIVSHHTHVHNIDTQAAMSITGSSGSGGTGSTGTANPPYLVFHYIVKT